MTQLNKQAYQQLISGDIEFLNQLPNTQERRHIRDVLIQSVELLYPDRNNQTKKGVIINGRL
jgi:hypothetical protein